MLKYKLNIKNTEKKLIEVKYESLYLSKDGSYLTGITDPSYCLNEENEITVVSDETQICTLLSEDVIACGYVLFNETYDIEDFGDTIGILYNDGQYYCVNKDFQFFERNVRSETVLSTLDKEIVTPKITINGKEYEIGTINEEGEIEPYSNIVVPTKYWSLNNQIIIHDIIYDVIIDAKTSLTNDENFYPYIILNDLTLDDENRILYVIDWEYSKRRTVTVFKIKNNNNFYLRVEEGSCVKQIEYFDNVTSDGEIERHYITDYENVDEFYHLSYVNNRQIFNEWKKVESNNVIDLYVSENVNNILNTSQLLVKPSSNSLFLLSEEKSSGSNEIVFNYYGKRYICNCSNYKDYLIINNNKYEIFTYNNENYIIFNQCPLPIRRFIDSGIEKGEMVLPSFYEEEKSQFNVKRHYIITIEDNKCEVYETEKEGIYRVDLLETPSLPLKITRRFGNNVLRCIPSEDDVNLSSLFNNISLSPNNFIFEIKVPLFSTSLVTPIAQDVKEYVGSDIKLFINHSSFIIPIKLEADATLNLHKDDVIAKQYVEDVKNDLINRIVDMEKDIYYPAHLQKKGGKDILTLCHKIQIDLHFRSRNLEDWTINEPNDIDEYGGLYPSNWNIFDKYRYRIDTDVTKSLQPILNLKDDLQYYPPSDLLYFLNFTDEDVFYQKQKIGKSFLRLSFYDSPNPNNQNLLYSSTVFMSETELFQKYINSDKNLTHYITIKERGKMKEKHLFQNDDYNHTEMIRNYDTDDNIHTKRISVSTEPCINDKALMITFDEQKRLSSSFVIKNRNECVDSCEGFYLYLFKEYSNWTHERSIYMRVQFNHAGVGRTINFMLLYHKDNKGNKSMINWSSKFNFDKYKDGCPLNELYEHLYIEIKVKYDIINKRFCYYLPEWMSNKNSDKNTMRLSLFEIKIKDES